VTSAEQRTRAAMDAITGLVEGIPPLSLPPSPAAGSRSRRRRGAPSPGRRWGEWLTPLTAAVAVVAIAIALVVVRETPEARPSPAGSPAQPAGIPKYYLTFDQPWTDKTKPVGLVLGDTLTGKKLFTLQPPPGLSFSGITGAADDRTFVAAAHPGPYGVSDAQTQSRSWYLVRVAGTGARVSLTMTRLPIPSTPANTFVEGIALSPDGTKLAVATQPSSANPKGTEVLRVYSVATGTVLRSWSSAPGQDRVIQRLVPWVGADANATLSWVGNQALAYDRYGVGVMVLELSHPDGSILASSRLIRLSYVPAAGVPAAGGQKTAPAHSPYRCGLVDIAIAGDGKSLICGGSGVSTANRPDASTAKLRLLWCPAGTPAWNTVAFSGFSLTTGKQVGAAIGYRTGCPNVAVVPLWASNSGGLVIGYFGVVGRTPLFGVYGHNAFWPLPTPLPGNAWPEYGGLANQLAW
jgi:hypothetical protein